MNTFREPADDARGAGIPDRREGGQGSPFTVSRHLPESRDRLFRPVSFFEPLPPPPQPSERRWSPPAWDRPSEGTLPATLAVEALLNEEEDAVWVIPTLDVFPNGFRRVNVVLLLNPHRAQDIQARIHRGPMGMMRIGVRFADGRVGGPGLSHGSLGVQKDDDGFPIDPFVGFGGGGGGTGGWRFSARVLPLPPDGPLEIFVALPAPATGEFSTIVDGSAVRAAAERARVIWT
jgi:hypothetical protein